MRKNSFVIALFIKNKGFFFFKYEFEISILAETKKEFGFENFNSILIIF